MKKIFRYGEPDRRSFILTLICIIVFVAAALLMWLFSGWMLYTRALLSAIMSAIVLLLVLSIPRRIEVAGKYIDIHCLVEFTRISLAEVSSIRILGDSAMRKEIPLLASYGFFGYYGYYLNLETLKISTLYCTTWSGFVEITDNSEKRYVISCDDPDAFVQAVASAIQG